MQKILEKGDQLVEEGIVDMFKNLLIQCPSSHIVLEMCCTLIDFKLSRSINDGPAMQFWLFTIRAAADDNTSLPRLKDLFLRYSSCLPGTETANGEYLSSNSLFGSNSVALKKTQRDQVFLDYLKVT